METVKKKLPFNLVGALAVFLVGGLLAWGYTQLSKKEKPIISPPIIHPEEAEIIVAPTLPPHNTPTPGNPRLDNPTDDYKEELKENQIAQGVSEIKITKNGFSPDLVTLKKGGIITFVNQDEVDHQPTGDQDGWGTKIVLAPGKKYSQQFDVPGSYSYSCKLVPKLKGEVVVVD